MYKNKTLKTKTTMYDSNYMPPDIFNCTSKPDRLDPAPGGRRGILLEQNNIQSNDNNYNVLIWCKGKH